MDQASFKRMWERMQQDGYFRNHPHYSDHFGTDLSDKDRALDAAIIDLDFDTDDIVMPAPYSEALERAVMRTESIWLPKMFELPAGGTAFDLGCGFGRTVAWLKDRYATVHASDISAEVIDEAKRRIGKAPNVQFHVNEADTLPSDIAPGTVDVAYIFTVFQHIPREYAASLLSQVTELLSDSGVAVFNLISGANENLNDGAVDTEWAIGYSHEQAAALVAQAGLQTRRIVRWSRPETPISWLWVLAGR